MKKLIVMTLLTAGSLLCGILFFAWLHEWFVIYFPSKSPAVHFSQPLVRHKLVTYYFPKAKEGQKGETADLVWSEDEAQNLTHLLKGWCALMYEERMLAHRVTVHRVVVADGYAYLSFDRPPIEHESTREKIALLCAAAKTIAANSNAVTHIMFLINQQPWQDTYLDFSSAWPISCFSS